MSVARPLISLCMIARNEEHNLARCLASVEGVVDEIVLVDTGSSDRTPDIAVAHGARIVPHTWTDDFSTARNIALAHACGQWILVLDADEELDVTVRHRVRGLAAGATWDAARVRVRNLQPPGDLCTFYECRVTRLFRNLPPFRFEGIVHEQIAPAVWRAGGTVGDADLTIIHHGYARPTAQGTAERAARNIRLLERALAATPDDSYLRYQYGATLKMAGAKSEARRAFEQALCSSGDDLSPEIVDLVHMKLAQLALAEGRLEEVTTHARASLAARPDNVLSLLALGLALLFAGDVMAAYPVLQQARAVGRDQVADAARLETILAYCQQQCPSVSHPGGGKPLPRG
jgi:glycosyltransferase involved in cell wall biosynthesis